ncbi:NADPH:quinone reductase [Sphaerisporangium krabiense]|uniref:NADPH:quinone reductase-like Zn-dependent oxidoreductase n=1 Tax=Sphaerisporangium krabiense TaxID=763782 RepID=A0A7W9DN28_9ACTN|nr:NAD(P)-dependent alcohol dehydrogenase [Sphaerisporangium krabiense]MBB5624966.1 NADPH:quinone reductase-like Zn-dependent oxidoreductase [Sphaerisporangium krabiense]GII66994.1 NADPH:quinone reductase [Sphaerisporangium krabiense]
MKAIVQDRFGSFDALELRDVARPVAGDGEVLVRVHAAGVDQGVWHLMAGLPYPVRLAGFGLRRPKFPVRGRDIAGVVEEVGRNVTRFAPGDEVFGTSDGSYAEYAAVREDRLAPKPPSLTLEQAAAVPASACTALKAVRDAGRVRPGQRVLITGAGGGVGTYTVQIAKAFGGEVTGVCSTGKADLVRSLGAEDVIDYTREDFATRARGFDVAIDIAGIRSLRVMRAALAPRGTLVLAGGEGSGRLLGGTHRQLVALVLNPFVGHTLRPLLSAEPLEDLLALTDLIESGAVRPVIDRAYPLDQAPEALRHLREGRARGKFVITV